jgi:hypothetical protein
MNTIKCLHLLVACCLLMSCTAEQSKSSPQAQANDASTSVIDETEEAISTAPNEVEPRDPFHEKLLPTITNFENNPHIRITIDHAKKAMAASTDDYKTRIITDRELDFSEAPSMVRLAELLCHPQSPMKDDASFIDPLMQRLYIGINSTIHPKGRNHYSFGTQALMRAYAIVLNSKPELISNELKASAEEAFRISAEDIIQKNPAFFEADSFGSWVNGDVRFIEALMWAGILLDDKKYTIACEKGVDYISRSLLKDGGYLYAGNVNDTYTYHAHTVESFAMMDLVGNIPKAKEMIVKTRAYYPLSIEPSGVAEYSTAACWKPYWNRSMGSEGAMIVADYTNCSYNKYVAELSLPKSTLFLASYYRPDLEPKSEDNYVAYDYNIGGPRGRFGDWSFSGTARPYGDEYRGKGTFSGCMILDEGAKPADWNLNAAMHEAGLEIRSAPASAGYIRNSHHTSHGGNLNYSISYDDQNGVITASDCAALGTVYKLSRYKAKGPQPCTARQTWIYTPKRIVGLLEISPDEDIQAYSLSASLKLVSGRAWWGQRKELIQVTPNAFKYGKLNILVHDNSFGPSTIRYEETSFSGDSEKTGRLSFLDKAGYQADEQKKQTYKAGERRHVLIEVYPDNEVAAQKIKLGYNTEELKAFSLIEADGTEYRVYHNTTAEGTSVAVELNHDATLWGNGYQFRPDWLEPYEGNQANLTSVLKSGQHEVALPAYGVSLLKMKNSPTRAVKTTSSEVPFSMKENQAEIEVVEQKAMNAEATAFESALNGNWQEAFQDDCTSDWQEQWILDGEIGTVENSAEGMTLAAGPEFRNDAHHIVLWTKETFKGDVKIEYEYTRLDDETSCVTILYIQATGSGVGDYGTDIMQWKELRRAPSMRTYFDHMNLYHISYAAYGNSKEDRQQYVRSRRYMPELNGLKGTELFPDYYPEGLFETGVPHQITVIKKSRDLYMKVENADQTRYFHMTNPNFPTIEEGYIGLRHMFTRSARYKNFRVSIAQ